MRDIYIYVAGPITGSGNKLQNAVNAIEVAEQLMGSQIPGVRVWPLVPHLGVFWEIFKQKPAAEWQAWDDAWLRKCDALVRLPGASPGSDHEVALAREIGIPVFKATPSLPDVSPSYSIWRRFPSGAAQFFLDWAKEQA